MGWSCRREAGIVMNTWTRACLAQTESSNVYIERDVRYFWELDNVGHDDGAITGSIQKCFEKDGKSLCVEVGAFRIEGDGRIARAPKFLVDAAGAKGGA